MRINWRASLVPAAAVIPAPIAYIKVIFGILFCSNFIANFDHGIIPALNTTLKEEYNLNSVQMGSLGSIVYFGNVVGSVLGMPLFRRINTKSLLITSLVIQMISLASFTIVSKFQAQEICRFITGITQVMFTIYIPVWVDLFAPKKEKSLWMTTMIGGVILGMLLGYIVAALIITFAQWEWAFYFQILAIIPLIVAISFVKKPLMDVTQESMKAQHEGSPEPEQEDETEDDTNNSGELTHFQMWRMEKLAKQEEKAQGMTFWQQFKLILSNADFVLFMTGLTCNFAIICGLQFWTTDYLIQVMGCEKNEAFIIYGVSGMIGPVGGIICTAIVFDKLGGYTGQNSLAVCSIVLSVAFTCCASSVVTNNSVATGFFVCIELFCGAFCMPALTGMMINSVPPTTRTTANSIANFCFNLFGWLPAPSIYGIVYESQGGGDSRSGLAAIQSFGFILLTSTVIAYIRQRVQFSKALRNMNANNLNLEGMAFDKSGEMIVKTTMKAGKRERKFSHEDDLSPHKPSFRGSTGFTIDQETTHSTLYAGKCQ